MQIGFIGYGNMAKALATRWVGHHPIAIGGRNPDKAKALIVFRRSVGSR